MSHCWQFLSPFFAGVNYRIPPVTYIRDLGAPHDTTFILSVHCREAARLLLFMVRRSFSELSKATFIPMNCSIVRSYLEYAIEASSPNLRADMYHLERGQSLAIRLLRGLRNVPYEETLRQFNLFSLEYRRVRHSSDSALAYIGIEHYNTN